tara:strand:+ start:817 stop:1095 length:279 start_codon:yes stop_codon:yes gene_type:complete
MNFVNDKAEVSKRDLEVRDQEINELKDKLIELKIMVNTLVQQNEALLKKLKKKDEEIKDLKDRLQDALLTIDSDTDNEYLKIYKSYHLKLHL